MGTTKLSSKGQLILPKSLRDAYNWQPGTEFIVEEAEGGVYLRALRPLERTRLADVIGSAGYRGPAKSLDDMEQAIAKGVKARHGRGRH